MKPCRECRHEISEQAFACPHCGAPYPARDSWDGWGYEYKSKLAVAGLPLSGGKLSLRQALIRDCFPIVLSSLAVANGLPHVIAGLDPYKSELNWLDQLQIFGSLIWFAAELVTMLTNSKRRAIHDYLARSVVVRLAAYERVSSNNAAAA